MSRLLYDTKKSERQVYDRGRCLTSGSENKMHFSLEVSETHAMLTRRVEVKPGWGSKLGETS